MAPKQGRSDDPNDVERPLRRALVALLCACGLACGWKLTRVPGPERCAPEDRAAGVADAAGETEVAADATQSRRGREAAGWQPVGGRGARRAEDEAGGEGRRAGGGGAVRVALRPRAADRADAPDGATSREAQAAGAVAATGAGRRQAAGPASLPAVQTGGPRAPARRPARPDPGAADDPPADGPAEEARPPSDPGLAALAQLGVDLDRPDAEMQRLTAEYRVLLLARAAAAVAEERDGARLALLDRGMAALIRLRPGTAGTVYSLLAAETQPPPAHYYARLIQYGDRAPVEGGLLALASGSADAWRRASGVVALGPAPSGVAQDSVERALLDPELEVRQAGARVLAELVRIRPGERTAPGFRAAIDAALAAETDRGQRDVLLRLLPAPVPPPPPSPVR